MGAIMDSDGTLHKTPRAFVSNSLAIAAVAAALALLAPVAPPAFAADNAPSAADQQCLGCHGAAGMEKKLADGDTLKLHVPADLFAKSVHSPNTCASCHSDIDPTAHPPSKKDIKSARSYAVAATEACRGCHVDKFKEWEGSIHAALVRSGNPAAPICSDCHNPHAIIKGAAAKLDETPCQNCHKDIFTAYLGSVHAKSRRNSADELCADLLRLPQRPRREADLDRRGPEGASVRAVTPACWKPTRNGCPMPPCISRSCHVPACHAPEAQRKVDLMLIDSQAKPRGTEQLGVPLFDASTRSDSKGIDAQTLWNLLQTLNRDGVAGNKTILRGRLSVRTGPQAHQLADKSKALSDCHTCHRQGSQAFQSVTISLVGPDGRRVGYGANADVLNSAFSVDAVSGFYAIGGTRIWLLDILLALAILGGLGIAIGHVALGWIFKRFGLYHPHTGGHGDQPAGGDWSQGGMTARER